MSFMLRMPTGSPLLRHILYSYELVSHSLLVPEDLTSADPLERVTAALARARLQLRRVGDHRYIVTRAPPPPPGRHCPPQPSPWRKYPSLQVSMT